MISMIPFQVLGWVPTALGLWTVAGLAVAWWLFIAHRAPKSNGNYSFARGIQAL